MSLRRCQVDRAFEQYVSVHRTAAPQTKADLWKAVGK
jgi:hypothetical protein